MKKHYFLVYTCRPNAKTYGTISFIPPYNESLIRDIEKTGQPVAFEDLNCKDFKNLPHGKVMYVTVANKTRGQAERMLKEHNPGINEVRAAEGRSIDYKPKGRYWSYASY